MSLRRKLISNVSNLKEGFYHRSYALCKKDLNGLRFNSQSLREWVCQERERKKMWSIDACLYSYHLYLSGFLYVLSFSLFFLLFLSTSPSFRFSPLSSSFFTVHKYPFLYYLSWWYLPFLPLNCIWLLMGVLPGLPISLLAT